MTFRERVIEAAQHRGGMKVQACLQLDPGWFTSIQAEVQSLLNERKPSDVSSKAHPTNWTNPYGNVTQHSLYNDSGNTADTTTDHNLKIEGKVFAAADYQALQRLFRPFENRALNFRLNGLMAKSGLSPHEENIIHGDKLRLRLHLPLFTNRQAKVMLDGESFGLQPGYIYFFNNGSVHAAVNESTEPRYHLVWDLFLDEWVEENILDLDSPAVPADGFRKVTPQEAAQLCASEPWHIDEYVNYKGELVQMNKTVANA
jgi:hypothetical protein